MIRYIGVGTLVMLALGTAQVAEAQPRPERPYRGLFGSGFGETAQSLTANGSFGVGWDENVLLSTGVGGRTARDPRAARQGGYGIGSGGLRYSLQRGVLNVGAAAVSTTRYYPGIIGNEIVSSQRGSVNAAFTLGRTRFFAGQAYSYQPYNLVTLMFLPPSEGLPDDVELPDEDLSISPIRYTAHTTTAGASHAFQLGRRGTLGFNYNYARVDLSTRSDVFWRHGASARYSYQLTRGLSVYAGYYAQEVWYPREGTGPRRVRVHNADGGVDFSRALSMSLARRMTLTFSTGSSAFASGNDENLRTRYRVTGSATLNREVGRTWNARLGYSRGVNFVETFDRPFLYDAVYASYGGLINRRLRFGARVGASFGNLGLTARNHYKTYNGRTSLDYAVSRFVSAGVSYSYSRYTFGEGAALPESALRLADRQGARAYVTAWAPLFTSTRRPDAPR